MQKTKQEKTVIAIIGGGFCGALTCVQLIRNSSLPLSIKLINKENPPATGIAFNSYNPNHLLNVAAGKMSAFPDQPNHFCEWILSKQEFEKYHNESLSGLFLPRNIYGMYLRELFDRQLQRLPGHIDVTVIHDEAIDIDITDHSPVVILKKNGVLFADKIILTTGNFVPAHPRIQNKDFYNENTGYFANPWKEDAVKGIQNCRHILIVGTGLTMVDNVLSLMENGYTGEITAVSTKGFFPLSHKKTILYSDVLDELNVSMSLKDQYHVFKKHIRKVLLDGVTGEVVVDAVRPLTQQIWMNLSRKEKISFMQHLRHLWGVARHRLPANIHQQITNLMQSGKLKIVAGRLYNMEQVSKDTIIATIKQRKTGDILEVKADRIINCTGPQTDIRKMEQPLIQNLIKKELICPDEMTLGMNATPDGVILNAQNIPSDFLFTIGSNLKGILWESTAVPELRVQAENLAKKIILQLTGYHSSKILVRK